MFTKDEVYFHVGNSLREFCLYFGSISCIMKELTRVLKNKILEIKSQLWGSEIYIYVYICEQGSLKLFLLWNLYVLHIFKDSNNWKMYYF